MWVDGHKDQLIDVLAEERQWSANSAREALDSAPAMFSQAANILKSAISYQNNVVEQIRDKASGEADLRPRMVSDGIQLAKYLADTAVSSVLSSVPGEGIA